MTSKGGSGKSVNAEKKVWSCSECSHKLAVTLNDSAIMLYSREGREFKITYDSASTICPECGSFQDKTSPLLKAAIIETIKKLKGAKEKPRRSGFILWMEDPIDKLIMKIRMRAWGVRGYRDFFRVFPEENIEMPSKERNQFLNLLSENEKKAYKVMLDSFDGTIGNPKVIKAIKKELGVTKEEARLRYDEVLGKLRDFKDKDRKWSVDR